MKVLASLIKQNVLTTSCREHLAESAESADSGLTGATWSCPTPDRDSTE